MKYDLLHNSKDYNSLKSSFDKLKKEFPNDFYIDKIYSRKLEKFDKIEESEKVKREIVKKYLNRIKKEPEEYSLRYDLSIFYQHTLKEYDKSIEIYRFLIDEKYKIDEFFDDSSNQWVFLEIIYALFSIVLSAPLKNLLKEHNLTRSAAWRRTRGPSRRT